MSAPPLTIVVANCRKKRRYSDEYAARAGAQLFLEETNQEAIGVYHCNLCLGWHWTRNAARKHRVTREHLFLNPVYVR